ncbi:hypothetical protein [Streptomyces sp. NPDC051567]|uniref:hypothetical protein n=1 Tax=Streptomyces sp. NPDC051567 TaxID=3365660 RepID=UPI0037A84D2B
MVHNLYNLHTYAWGRHPVEPYDWAVRFHTRVRELITAGRYDDLAAYDQGGPDATLAVPNPRALPAPAVRPGLPHPRPTP